jgi:hypothetical protein
VPRKSNRSGFAAVIGGIFAVFFADICAVGAEKQGTVRQGVRERGSEGTENRDEGTGGTGRRVLRGTRGEFDRPAVLCGLIFRGAFAVSTRARTRGAVPEG